METIDSATYQRLLAREKRKEAADTKGRGVRRKPRHLESELQRRCVTRFRLEHPELKLLLFAVPNGGHRSAAEAVIMQAEGVTPGVSDLLLLVPRGDYHGLCIEMKIESKKSGQTEDQVKWQKAVESQGFKYIVARTDDSFCNGVNEYLKGEESWII